MCPVGLFPLIVTLVTLLALGLGVISTEEVLERGHRTLLILWRTFIFEWAGSHACTTWNLAHLAAEDLPLFGGAGLLYTLALDRVRLLARIGTTARTSDDMDPKALTVVALLGSYFLGSLFEGTTHLLAHLLEGVFESFLQGLDSGLKLLFDLL